MSVLVNRGLEQGEGYADKAGGTVLVFREDGTPIDTIARGEDNPPAGWGIWYTWEQAAPPWDPGNEVGHARPETRYAPHLERVQEGESGFVMYSFYRIHHGGLFQRVEDLEPGVRYQFTIGNHAWSSTDDNPLTSDGAPGPFYRLLADLGPDSGGLENYRARVGVDPTCGLDPFADDVVWGPWAVIYNAYRDLPPVSAVTQSERMTVFTEHRFLWPFEHCDAYYDGAVLATSQDQPVHDGWTDGRAQYERTFVLLPPGAGAAWARAVIEATWDEMRWTLGGSADDAGIGPEVRRVIPVNPHMWVNDLEAFFLEHYAGIEYVPAEAATPDALIYVLNALIAGSEEPGGPEEPDEPPVTPPSGGMQRFLNLPVNLAGGLHVKGLFEYWQELVRDAPPGVLKVFSAGDAYHIGQFARALEPDAAQPKTRSVWRRYVSNDGAWVNVADRRASARAFLALYQAEVATAARNLGITEAELLRCIDYIGSINEVIGTFDPETPRLVEFDVYFAEAIDEWAGGLVKGTLLTVAVGNPHESEVPLLLPVAEVSHRDGHLLDYHGYWTATREQSFLGDHWQYHAGRWAAWDEVFTAHGLYPLYMAGEAGVVASHSADGTDFGGGESWKVLGDFPNYLAMIRKKNDLIRAWNATHGDRMLGDALFTGEFWGWDHFKIGPGDVRLLIEGARTW